MTNRNKFFLLLSVSLIFLVQTAFAQKPILRRSDSFLGLHFDFHAGPADTLIGKTLTEGMVDSLLNRVKPDFIQVDCKGHSGFTSYPTKVGNTPPGHFLKDPLKLFRAVTKRHGVALYVHYSGVWDTEAIRKHPNWARIDANGKPDPDKTSFWSAYADSLLIPQLKEISDYGVDGVWVDGDSWAVELDYRPDALEEFRKETGITTVPRKRDDPHYKDFLAFTRKKFKEYVTKYATALHTYNPKFQVASNWAFSSFQPEEVDIPIDFISGDFTPNNSVLSGAYEARAIAPQGKPWDLMAWSFGGNNSIWGAKSSLQLCQEAAQVMAMGGGFQAYWSQNRDASLPPWSFETMGQMADFCRARQPFCFKTQPLPQVAVLYSTAGQKNLTNNVYKSDGSQQALRSVTELLLYNQLSTEIRMTHTLKGQMQKYPLIVIPEWEVLGKEEREDLLSYVNEGGNLLVIGTKAVNNFEEALGVKLGEVKSGGIHFGSSNLVTSTSSDYHTFTPSSGVKTLGGIYSARDLRYFTGPAASVASYGKGKIAGVYINLGENYQKNDSYISRQFVGDVVKELFKPKVEVTGSKFVHVAVNQKKGHVLVNLLNLAGSHKSAAAFDEIPVLGPLQVKVKAAKKPGKLTLQPEGKILPFTYTNGEIAFTVNKLAIHSIVDIE